MSHASIPPLPAGSRQGPPGDFLGAARRAVGAAWRAAWAAQSCLLIFDPLHYKPEEVTLLLFTSFLLAKIMRDRGWQVHMPAQRRHVDEWACTWLSSMAAAALIAVDPISWPQSRASLFPIAVVFVREVANLSVSATASNTCMSQKKDGA